MLCALHKFTVKKPDTKIHLYMWAKYICKAGPNVGVVAPRLCAWKPSWEVLVFAHSLQHFFKSTLSDSLAANMINVSSICLEKKCCKVISKSRNGQAKSNIAISAHTVHCIKWVGGETTWNTQRTVQMQFLFMNVKFTHSSSSKRATQSSNLLVNQ